MFGNYCERNIEPDEEESVDSLFWGGRDGHPAFVCETTMHLPILNFRMEQKCPLLLVTHNLRAFAARQTESLHGVDRLICEGEEEGRITYPIFLEQKDLFERDALLQEACGMPDRCCHKTSFSLRF